MKLYRYLIIDERKNTIVRMNKVGSNKLTGRKLVIKLAIDVPDDFFKQPVFEASIEVPESALPEVKTESEIVPPVEDSKVDPLQKPSWDTHS